MRWLLFDYGGVLSLPQPAEDRALLEEAAGRSDAEFWNAYWRHRIDYDRGGLSSVDYWRAVLGRRLRPRELDQLVERDVASWMHPNLGSLAASARAARRGLGLAILSNAPHELADVIDRVDWLAPFTPRLFSCRLGSMKPDKDSYDASLAALGASPHEVTFLDDRQENVCGARRAGLRAQLFTDPTEIDAAAEP